MSLLRSIVDNDMEEICELYERMEQSDLPWDETESNLYHAMVDSIDDYLQYMRRYVGSASANRKAPARNRAPARKAPSKNVQPRRANGQFAPSKGCKSKSKSSGSKPRNTGRRR